MAQNALSLTREMIELWNAGELERLYDTFDPDVVVRPDPNFPEGACFGIDAARRFWDSQVESMGLGHIVIEQEHDLGDRCLMRIHQPVHSRSGIESSYSWSWIATWRSGKLVFVEFFIDEDEANAALGLETGGSSS